MTKTYLITGGAGFVGSHLVEHILKTTDDSQIVIADALNYSGTLDRIRDIELSVRNTEGYDQSISALDHPRVRVITYDFTREVGENLIKELQGVTHVLHLGAESHVDRSIEDPMRFVYANVVGTTNMLNLARRLENLEVFVYFSTDEVFGPAPMEKDNEFKGFKETDSHDPKNPYAATKSAAEQIVNSFANTYNLPCIITRGMNIFGERQHPEKFIPMCISKAIYGGIINVHSTPCRTQAGMRHYIHGRNVADALMFLLRKQPWLFDTNFPRQVESYHIVGELEVDNLTLARTINEYVGIVADEIGMFTVGVTTFNMIDFHGSRPGHDLRYALDGSKMEKLGWKPPKTFHESLRKTIKWYLQPEKLKWLT